jgi:hypothetical protein
VPGADLLQSASAGGGAEALRGLKSVLRPNAIAWSSHWWAAGSFHALSRPSREALTRFRKIFPGRKQLRIREFHAHAQKRWFAGAACWLSIGSVMKQPARARPKSRRDPVLDPQTADELSRAVTSIVKRLRAGHPVKLPGIGNLLPGKTPRFVKEGGQDGGQETPRAKRRER